MKISSKDVIYAFSPDNKAAATVAPGSELTFETSVDEMSHEEMKAFIDEHGVNCPVCGKHSYTAVREFNLMFKTHLGPVESDTSIVYLRPETCQGIFVDFKNIVQSNSGGDPKFSCRVCILLMCFPHKRG